MHSVDSYSKNGADLSQYEKYNNFRMLGMGRNGLQ